jgi:DNA-binding transcriptional LysR family regulator
VRRGERSGRRVKLRNLSILQAAAAGSMAKAAADLGISQPAVSYAVTEMEQVLGVPLLDRTSQGVTPTAYGRVLLERSVVVFNELHQAISEAYFADIKTKHARKARFWPRVQEVGL